MAKRTAETVRAERDVVAAQIEKLRAQQRALSDELRDIEGPIPDRSQRTNGVGYRVVKAAQ